VFVEGGACATAQWHYGQSKPDVWKNKPVKEKPSAILITGWRHQTKSNKQT